MTLTTPVPTAPTAASQLRGRRLPTWAGYGVAAAAVLLAVVLNLTTSVDGVAGTTVVAVLLFLVGLTGWSFAVEGRRHAIDRLATTVVYATFVAAFVPLAWILLSVVAKGIGVLNWAFLTGNMRSISASEEGGGVMHALIGTLQQVGLATLMSVPIGVLAAIYLVEYGAGKRLAYWISFFVDVMTGVPSIVTGLFIYTALILAVGLPQSGFAAALALTILMIPVIIRSTEEMLKIVPNDLREAAYALGIPKWKTILKIVIPTALSGIITGVMLAVARVTGETAPLLLVTFLAQSTNWNAFNNPQTSLPTFIWDQISRGTDQAVARAWGGALVLILVVLVFYGGARLIAARFAPKR
ncbi:MAG: phosphate ABC transporter permease PstA [Actinomycetota bacterium]|nr:MAG: phosphate ABC transporter permease PstA [Actinomycetota bacterium]